MTAHTIVATTALVELLLLAAKLYRRGRAL